MKTEFLETYLPLLLEQHYLIQGKIAIIEDVNVRGIKFPVTIFCLDYKGNVFIFYILRVKSLKEIKSGDTKRVIFNTKEGIDFGGTVESLSKLSSGSPKISDYVGKGKLEAEDVNFQFDTLLSIGSYLINKNSSGETFITRTK